MAPGQDAAPAAGEAHQPAQDVQQAAAAAQQPAGGASQPVKRYRRAELDEEEQQDVLLADGDDE